MLRPALIGLLAGLTGCDLVFGLSRAQPDGGSSDAADAGTDATDAKPRDECADPTLVLCMLFEDDLTGRADDSSPENNHATVINVASVSRGQQRAVARTAASEISIPEDGALDLQHPATIATWFYVNATPAINHQVILLDNDLQYGISFNHMNLVKCGAVLAPTFAQISVSRPTTPGAWHHVACVHQKGNDSRLTMYLDGNDVGTSISNGTMVIAGGFGVRLGENGGSGDSLLDPLTGMLDNVQIWKTAVPAAEIKAIWDSQ